MMLTACKITPHKVLRIKTTVASLDEWTRNLPQGFYSTFSTLSQGTRVMGLQAHLDRLYHPATERGLIPAVDEPALRHALAKLAHENLPHESRMRVILDQASGAVYVGLQPFVPLGSEIYADGVKVVTAQMARSSPRLKDTGFISSSVEQRRLVGQGTFEVLMVRGGRVLEGMTSNFYAVKGRSLITARNGILLGVTRRAVLRLARGQGMSIEYRPPALTEKFNEAILTSSSRGVVPIVEIDGRAVGQGMPGKWTQRLGAAYQAYVQERSEPFIP